MAKYFTTFLLLLCLPSIFICMDNNILWEEKESTTLMPSASLHSENDNNVITTETNEKSESETLPPTILPHSGGIYKIVHKASGKYYVGSTHNFNHRWIRQHLFCLRHNKHCNDKLQHAWNKYGEAMFEFVIVKHLPAEQLILVEQQYLDIAKDETDKCYNLSFDADRVNFTQEVRKKMSDAKLGTKLPEVAKQALRDLYAGVKKLPEHTTHIREAKQGLKNPSADHTIYRFFNKRTLETYIGVRCEFFHKYNLHRNAVGDLVNGKTKSCHGWSVIT